jgi:hypothetical protein
MSLYLASGHLRHLLKSYQNYYNEARTHLSLHKDSPVSRAVQTVGRMLAIPVRKLIRGDIDGVDTPAI